MAELLSIDVVYGLLHKQKTISLQCEAGTTAQEAVVQSNINQYFPEIDLKDLTIGIYGKKCKQDYVLNDHDRVEIYRPLIADPKEVRKKRAAEGKKMGKNKSSSKGSKLN